MMVYIVEAATFPKQVNVSFRFTVTFASQTKIDVQSEDKF